MTLIIVIVAAIVIYVWLQSNKSNSSRSINTAKREPERFENRGTTTREREVARLLNRRLPIVEGVRFAYSSGQLRAFVDLFGGNSFDGGTVDEALTAQQQADSIYRYVNALLNL